MVRQTPLDERDETAASGAISVILPAYNEEGAVGDEVTRIREVLDASGLRYELIVVDDGSTDRTAELAEAAGARLIQHIENRGYGAALKTGIRKAKHDIIVITDADGTYPPEAIPELVAKLGPYDMVVGARTGDVVHIPFVRRPAKWLLARLASYLAEREIPDLNSGLRAMKRSVVTRFEQLLPNGFSFTTTITLAMLCNDYLVYYHPIDYGYRIGESKVRPTQAYEFFLLVVRTIVYFNPLRIFLPLGAVLFVTAMVKFVYDLFMANISDTVVLGFLGAIIVWAIGLLSDQIAKAGIGKWTE